MKLTPPMMEDGIEPITAANFGEKLRMIAYTAAIRITLGSCTFDSSNTPVFSPYVVFAGPPMAPANAVASPSPIKVLWSPGSSTKFSSTVAEIAVISPICSIMVASAIGAITRIAVISNLHHTNGCHCTQCALATEVKSKIALPSAFVIPTPFNTKAKI